MDNADTEMPNQAGAGNGAGALLFHGDYDGLVSSREMGRVTSELERASVAAGDERNEGPPHKPVKRQPQQA